MISNVHANPNGDVITDTVQGNHLFTAKFEKYKSYFHFTGWCTAVVLTPTTSLTAGHCVEFQSRQASLGYVYPALSARLDPLSYMQITESVNYNGNTDSGAKDIAIIKGTDPSSSMKYYLKDKSPKIKTVDNISELNGRDVYTIGYPADKGSNYQIRYTGKITSEGSGAIVTNIKASIGGRSGAGLFLQGSDELIGILSGNDYQHAHFAPITKDVETWINENKTP